MSVYNLLDAEIKGRGMEASPTDILRMIFEKDPNFEWETFRKYIEENVGLHEFKINRNSFICGYVDWLLHSLVEVSLQ